MKYILPKGNTSSRTSAILVQGEMMYDRGTKRFYGGDGVTSGGRQFLIQDDLDEAISVMVSSGYIASAGHANTANTATSAGMATSAGTAGTANAVATTEREAIITSAINGAMVDTSIKYEELT